MPTPLKQKVKMKKNPFADMSTTNILDILFTFASYPTKVITLEGRKISKGSEVGL
jgi:hypothetical protein